MYGHGSYDELLAKKLKNPEFSKGFLQSLMQDGDGFSLLDALKHTIRRMGIKEFSQISGIPEKSISRMLNSESTPKLETLEKYCAPFGLKVSLVLENAA